MEVTLIYVEVMTSDTKLKFTEGQLEYTLFWHFLPSNETRASNQFYEFSLNVHH